MLLGSYTITLLKEEGNQFLKLYKHELLPILNESPETAEVALLEMTTQVDPTATSFSLQVKFESEDCYVLFSERDFPGVLKKLDILFPKRYAYFHTLLKYV